MGRPKKIQPYLVQEKPQAKKTPDLFEVAQALRDIGTKLGFDDGSREGFEAAVKVIELCSVRRQGPTFGAA